MLPVASPAACSGWRRSDAESVWVRSTDNPTPAPGPATANPSPSPKQPDPCCLRGVHAYRLAPTGCTALRNALVYNRASVTRHDTGSGCGPGVQTSACAALSRVRASRVSREIPPKENPRESVSRFYTLISGTRQRGAPKSNRSKRHVATPGRWPTTGWFGAARKEKDTA